MFHKVWETEKKNRFRADERDFSALRKQQQRGNSSTLISSCDQFEIEKHLTICMALMIAVFSASDDFDQISITDLRPISLTLSTYESMSWRSKTVRE